MLKSNKKKNKNQVSDEREIDDSLEFSNQERPYSCPQMQLNRPFSTSIQSGLKF